MAFAILAGIPLRVVKIRRRQDRVRGEIAAAFDVSLQDGRDFPRDRWEMECYPETPEDVDALLAAIASGPVAFTGEYLRGATRMVVVEMDTSEAGPDVQGAYDDWGTEDEAAFNETLTLTLREA